MNPQTIFLLFLTVALGPLMRSHPLFVDASVNTIAVKAAGIAVLAVSQWLGVSLHPFIGPHRWTAVGEHLLMVLMVAHILVQQEYGPGYKVVPGTSLVSAFLVPYSLFTGYLVLFSALIHKGWSKHWANLAFLTVLLVVDMHVWHPNPLVTAVSLYTYGFNWVYVVHVGAIAMAVLTSKVVSRLWYPAPKSASPIMRLICAMKGYGARKARSPKK